MRTSGKILATPLAKTDIQLLETPLLLFSSRLVFTVSFVFYDIGLVYRVEHCVKTFQTSSNVERKETIPSRLQSTVDKEYNTRKL